MLLREKRFFDYALIEKIKIRQITYTVGAHAEIALQTL